jgi:hypothetical protein
VITAEVGALITDERPGDDAAPEGKALPLDL